MPADLIGARYQLHRELARTPWLAVFEAEDQRLGTPTGVAVAVARGGTQEPLHVRRLFGRRMARTVHPHVVSTYDRGKDGNRAFVAFRAPPRTLAGELGTAPYPASRVTQMGLDLSSALATLHRAGIRLGSLHPGHVGIDADGTVRLSPWPLSRPPGGWGGQGAWSPPEIVAGASPSMAGDVWSLGAVLLSSLVGTGPGQLSEVATEELADRLRHDANPVLVDAIGRSMVTDPSSRFASATEMTVALLGETVSRRQIVAAGVPRLSAGARRLAVASAAMAGVLSATAAGVGLSTLGGSGIASSGGVDHRPAATAPPPTAVNNRPAPVTSVPVTAPAPKGASASSAIPASATAASARRATVTSASGGRITSTLAAASSPADEPNPPAVASPPSTPTTSAPTTTTASPPTTSGSGGTTTTTTTTTTSTTTTTTAPGGSGHGDPKGGGSPYSAGVSATATHGHD